MADENRDVATPTEVREAVAQLTRSQLLRLREVAGAFLFRETYGLDAEGLVHEALARMLRGTRTWPRNTTFVVAAKGAMESIADEYRKKQRRRPEDLEAKLEDAELGTIAGYSSQQLNADDLLSAVQAEGGLLALFEGKPRAQKVLRGLIDGMSPEEIRLKEALTETQYDSARKAICRERVRIIGILGAGKDST